MSLRPTPTKLKAICDLLASLGIDVDRAGPAQLLVRATPALLPNVDVATLSRT